MIDVKKYPAGTKVDRLYKKLRDQGYSEASAAKISQKATGLSLATGKPPKKNCVARYSQDKVGHEHGGKGSGHGGQFVSQHEGDQVDRDAQAGGNPPAQPVVDPQATAIAAGLAEAAARWKKAQDMEAAYQQEKQRKGQAQAKLSDTPEGRAKIAKSLSSSKTKGLTALNGGMNASSIVEMEDGMKGVWKPESGEDHDSFPEYSGTYWEREVAFYEVAKAVGMDDLVPVTVRRVNPENPSDVGSCQEFIENAETASQLWQNDVDDENQDECYDGKRDCQRAMIMDFIMGNVDRHFGNWMITSEGKLKLIDHGLCFPEYHSQDVQDRMGSNFAEHWGGEIPQDIVAEWDAKWPEVEKALGQFWDSSVAEQCRSRLDCLLGAKTMREAINHLSENVTRRQLTEEDERQNEGYAQKIARRKAQAPRAQELKDKRAALEEGYYDKDTAGRAQIDEDYNKLSDEYYDALDTWERKGVRDWRKKNGKR